MDTTEKLRALTGLGFSQHAIKRETKISQASISRILSGKQVDLHISTVKAVDALYAKAKRRKTQLLLNGSVKQAADSNSGSDGSDGKNA